MSNLDSSTGASFGHLPRPGSALEVLRIFLKLGLTCFGGPVALIGYFRAEFVVRRKWIDERAWRAPPLVVVAFSAAAGTAMALL